MSTPTCPNKQCKRAAHLVPLVLGKLPKWAQSICNFLIFSLDSVSHRDRQRRSAPRGKQLHEAWPPPPPPPPPCSAKVGPLGRISTAPWLPHAQGGKSASIATHPGGSHLAMATPAPLTPSSQLPARNRPPKRLQNFGKGAAARSGHPRRSIGGFDSKIWGRRGMGGGCDGQPWTPP